MGVWTELVGVRKDLRLRGKWWHHVAVGAGVFSSLIVYLIIAGTVVKRPPKLTTSNTFSETLLHESHREADSHHARRSGCTWKCRQCRRQRRFSPAAASGRSGHSLRKSGAVQSRPEGQGWRDELRGHSGSSGSAGRRAPALRRQRGVCRPFGRLDLGIQAGRNRRPQARHSGISRRACRCWRMAGLLLECVLPRPDVDLCETPPAGRRRHSNNKAVLVRGGRRARYA